MTVQARAERVQRKPLIDNYPHRSRDLIRFGDLDSQGHVNNAVYCTYFETGRGDMFRLPDLSIGVPDSTFVLVHFEIRYFRELNWPGNVEIGTGITRFGNSSFTLSQAIFCGGYCAAKARATMVLVEKITKQKRTLPMGVVERLSQWKMSAEEDLHINEEGIS